MDAAAEIGCFESDLLLYSKLCGYRSRHYITHEDRFISVL